MALVSVLRHRDPALGTASDDSAYPQNTKNIIVCFTYPQIYFFMCTVVILIFRWGRGHPEEYTEAIVIGEEKFDSDSDKKPRAGQILWIRGLTRLQTQVSLCITYIASNAV